MYATSPAAPAVSTRRADACLARASAIAIAVSAALALPHARAQIIGSEAGILSSVTPMPATPPHMLAQTWTVKNCNDSGTDSLRDIIENPMKAQTGDTVDLSQLPMLCGMAQSVITLGSEIVVAQDDLTIQGTTDASVTISGAGMSRAFHHMGAGTFALAGLTVTDGYYHTTMGPAYGGGI